MTELLGTYRGVVADNRDPRGQNRVRVQVPQVLGNAVSGWALPLTYYARPPAVGDRVWVSFEGGEVTLPIWSSPDARLAASDVLAEELLPPLTTAWTGTAPGFGSTGTWVAFSSAQWPSQDVVVPSSGIIRVEMTMEGRNSASTTSTLWTGYRLATPQGTVLKEPNFTDSCRVFGAVSSTKTFCASWQALTPGSTVRVIPCWQISSGSSATASFERARMWIYPWPRLFKPAL